MADKSTKDKFKDAVKGYVKSGVDAVKSTKLFRAAETAAKDAKQKAATDKAVAVAMDSKYEGKINPPKEPDMGVKKARMSRPTGPDRKEMAYNRRRSASEGRTVSKMAMGGKARGMGAATKGGSFSKNG